MNRAEVWLVNLDPTIGAEIQKTRPAIIVNNDEIGLLPLRIIVPVTDWKPHYGAAAWMVKIEPDASNKLTKTSTADCFQVRSVSQNRLIKQIGVVSKGHMAQIEIALKTVFSL
jgi:mRNA interferase MazF